MHAKQVLGLASYRRVAFWGVVNTSNVNHMIDTPPTHLTPTHVGQNNSARKMWEIGTVSALVMSAAAYLDSLDYEARKRYFHKLQTESEVLPDPYSLVNEQWIDDVRMWPNLELGISTLI